MDGQTLTWNRLLPDLLRMVGDDTIRLTGPLRVGTDTYLVPSPEKRELLFAIPVSISCDLPCDPDLPGKSLAGAVHLIIERIKKESVQSPALRPLSGSDGTVESRYASFCEPCTIASSPSRIATHLWRSDDQNRIGPEGIELLLRGTLPYRPPNAGFIPEIAEVLNRYADEVRDITVSIPHRLLEQAARVVWDQQDLRSRLSDGDSDCQV